jgi:hypothetical protein
LTAEATSAEEAVEVNSNPLSDLGANKAITTETQGPLEEAQRKNHGLIDRPSPQGVFSMAGNSRFETLLAVILKDG